MRRKGKRYESDGGMEVYQVEDKLCVITPDGNVLEGYWPEKL